MTLKPFKLRKQTETHIPPDRGIFIEQDNTFLTITQAASLLEVSQKTLKKWEILGIVTSQKDEKGTRYYDPEDIKRLLKTLSGSQSLESPLS